MSAIDMYSASLPLTLVGSSCNRDLGIGVQGPAKERGICIGNGLLEARTTLYITSQTFVIRGACDCIYLCRGVLVALNAIQRIFGGVNCELRGVIATGTSII